MNSLTNRFEIEKTNWKRKEGKFWVEFVVPEPN